MAVLDRLKYDAESDDWFVWKFPSDELRLGSQLVVNQSQEALFFKGGQALDLFGPGTHTLATGNLPLLHRLVNLPFGGQTPFTAEVWYVNKHVKRNLRWGTSAPIPLMDPALEYPVNVRAFGMWGVRVEDARRLVTQLVGTLRDLQSDRITEYFSGEIVQRLSDAIANHFVQQGVSILQANAKLNELSALSANGIRAEFSRFGLEVINFNIERISIPDEEMKRLQDVFGKKMEINQISKAQVGQAYVTKRTFDTLEKAASNESGTAGALLTGGLGLGLGVGAGLPVGKELGQAMNPHAESKPSTAGETDPVIRLQKLKRLLEADLIRPEDYETQKRRILSEL